MLFVVVLFIQRSPGEPQTLFRHHNFGRANHPMIIMRDFQTWLITQVMVARGAACQVISELPVCSDYTVYTSQAVNMIIKHT